MCEGQNDAVKNNRYTPLKFCIILYTFLYILKYRHFTVHDFPI